MPPSVYDDAIAQLTTLYAMLPSVACQGSCTHSCGPLALSFLERRRLQRQTGKKVREVTTPPCPLLRAGRCTVYAIRPLICRLYGVAETMACPHGCVPERVVSLSEVAALLHTVEEISQAVFPREGTCSLHADATILQVQEQAAAALCRDLWGVA